MMGPTDWPKDLDPRTVCLSVDVEWAAADVLQDLIRLFDERGLPATFFCTHDGVHVGSGHERGLHPNYRRNGHTMRRIREEIAAGAPDAEEYIYRRVLEITKTFAPEAQGVRSHSLFYDSQILEIYSTLGLLYDGTYALPLTNGLHPIWKEYGVLEMPVYYNDHFDLKTGATGFDASALQLDQPGLKIIELHPNMVFINARDNAHYLETKSFYHDSARLLEARHDGPGIRTLVLDLLDRLVSEQLPCLLMGDVSRKWRQSVAPWPRSR
ncbi:polysaccharide deacetylase WbmS family protein [Arenibaculum pallidiluteum]|uniref:polysaccharide deacetylase WbmS family protein n=1 Tax=Arenibaculum pallidiluteum TaxID=2812559 RepID=UPI001A95FE5A|nr:hypothetical protein [Arenibaculum pallidiluteum]